MNDPWTTSGSAWADGGRRARDGVPTPLRAPHVAEIVAMTLRNRILDGDLRDGDELPKQEDLLDEFRVSRPSIREALRILEAEGLVSVRRGKVGGAVVHRPKATNVAYSLGLVLRASDVPVDDVATALNHIEPICAALCAAREDRHEEVLPYLRTVHERAQACIADAAQFTVESRRFHEELVARSGNQTLIVLVGALESVWSGHARMWAERSLERGHFPDSDYRRHGLDDHELVIRLIERGEADAVEREVRRHLAWSPVYAVDDTSKVAPSVVERPNA